MMILGAVVGIVFGAIPGLTYSMGIILVLPLTFNLILWRPSPCCWASMWAE